MTARELEAVARAIVSCERCPRLRGYCRRIAATKRRAYRHEIYWARPVPGFGDRRARLLILGLAPAAHGANRTGRMFTGDGVGGAGDFLMAALHRAGFANLPISHRANDGLRLRGAFLTAAVRCAPPDNKPTPKEIANCLPHLQREIDALPAVRVVVALGKIAFDAYVRLASSTGLIPAPRPRFAHGAIYEMPGGWRLIGCYHPSRQNTHTGRLTAAMIDAVFREARAGVRARRETPRAGLMADSGGSRQRGRPGRTRSHPR